MPPDWKEGVKSRNCYDRSIPRAKLGAAELAKVWIPRTKGNLASSLLIALKSEPAKHYPNFGKLAKKLASFL